MSYVLMTKMQYLHLTGVIPRMSKVFESGWEKENKKRFERNHPMACKNNDNEYRKNEKIYQKFNFGRRPKEPLSGDALIQAVKICSERPDQCFYLEEALCQLGYHNIYYYEDRFNALLQVTSRGTAVLVEEGFGGGGASIPKPKEEGFINQSLNTGKGLAEAGLVTAHNSAWDAAAATGALAHGLLQLTKEGSIEDATRVAKESYKNFSNQTQKKLSSNAQKAVDENYILQGAGYAINNTVIPVIEKANEILPEPVTVFGGLALGAIPSGKSTIGKKSIKTNSPLTQKSINDKLEKYLLNNEHPIGKSKAKWFNEALGFNQNNIDQLSKQVIFDIEKAIEKEVTIHGIKYNQIINISGANGKNIDVNFAWIKNNDDVVRLVTSIPTKNK